MRKIIDYYVLEASTIKELNNSVKEHIRLDYEPLGPASHISEFRENRMPQYKFIYYQTVVKYKY